MVIAVQVSGSPNGAEVGADFHNILSAQLKSERRCLALFFGIQIQRFENERDGTSFVLFVAFWLRAALRLLALRARRFAPVQIAYKPSAIL